MSLWDEGQTWRSKQRRRRPLQETPAAKAQEDLDDVVAVAERTLGLGGSTASPDARGGGDQVVLSLSAPATPETRRGHSAATLDAATAALGATLPTQLSTHADPFGLFTPPDMSLVQRVTGWRAPDDTAHKKLELRRAVVASRKANRRPRNKQDATIKWRQEAAAPGTGSSTLGPFPRNDLPPLVASTTTRPIIRLDAKGCLVESHEEILSLFEEQPAILPPLKLYLLKKYGRRHDDLPLMPCADPKLRRERIEKNDEPLRDRAPGIAKRKPWIGQPLQFSQEVRDMAAKKAVEAVQDIAENGGDLEVAAHWASETLGHPEAPAAAAATTAAAASSTIRKVMEDAEAAAAESRPGSRHSSRPSSRPNSRGGSRPSTPQLTLSSAPPDGTEAQTPAVAAAVPPAGSPEETHDGPGTDDPTGLDTSLEEPLQRLGSAEVKPPPTEKWITSALKKAAEDGATATPKLPERVGICNYRPTGMPTRKLRWSRHKQELMGEMTLTRIAGLVSRTFVIVTIEGMNIAGRLFVVGEGAHRELVVKAYTCTNSETQRLNVGMQELQDYFRHRPHLLAAGHKAEAIRELLKLMYFDYHITEVWVRRNALYEETQIRKRTYSHTEPWHCRVPGYESVELKALPTNKAPPATTTPGQPESESSHHEAQGQPPGTTASVDSGSLGGESVQGRIDLGGGVFEVDEEPEHGDWDYKVSVREELRISELVRISAAETRREELRRKRAMEMAEKEAARKAWAALPRRLKGYKLGVGVRLRGFCVVAQVYEFPDRPKNAIFKAYNPDSGVTFEVTLSFTAVAKILDMSKDDASREWNPNEKLRFFGRVLRFLRFAATPDAKRTQLDAREISMQEQADADLTMLPARKDLMAAMESTGAVAANKAAMAKNAGRNTAKSQDAARNAGGRLALYFSGAGGPNAGASYGEMVSWKKANPDAYSATVDKLQRAMEKKNKKKGKEKRDKESSRLLKQVKAGVAARIALRDGWVPSLREIGESEEDVWAHGTWKLRLAVQRPEMLAPVCPNCISIEGVRFGQSAAPLSAVRHPWWRPTGQLARPRFVLLNAVYPGHGAGGGKQETDRPATPQGDTAATPAKAGGGADTVGGVSEILEEKNETDILEDDEQPELYDDEEIYLNHPFRQPRMQRYRAEIEYPTNGPVLPPTLVATGRADLATMLTQPSRLRVAPTGLPGGEPGEAAAGGDTTKARQADGKANNEGGAGGAAITDAPRTVVLSTPSFHDCAAGSGGQPAHPEPSLHYHPTTAWLGAGSQRGRWRRRRLQSCCPRRELGMGKRLTTGVAKLEGVRVVFTLWRRDPTSHPAGTGDRFQLQVYLPYTHERPVGGKVPLRPRQPADGRAASRATQEIKTDKTDKTDKTNTPEEAEWRQMVGRAEAGTALAVEFWTDDFIRLAHTVKGNHDLIDVAMGADAPKLRELQAQGEATSEALKLKIESAKQRREDLRDERLGTLVEKLVARHLCGAEDEDQEVAEGSGEKEETKEAPSKQGPIETETAVLQAFSAIDSEGKSSLGKKQVRALCRKFGILISGKAERLSGPATPLNITAHTSNHDVEGDAGEAAPRSATPPSAAALAAATAEAAAETAANVAEADRARQALTKKTPVDEPALEAVMRVLTGVGDADPVVTVPFEKFNTYWKRTHADIERRRAEKDTSKAPPAAAPAVPQAPWVERRTLSEVDTDLQDVATHIISLQGELHAQLELIPRAQEAAAAAWEQVVREVVIPSLKWVPGDPATQPVDPHTIGMKTIGTLEELERQERHARGEFGEFSDSDEEDDEGVSRGLSAAKSQKGGSGSIEIDPEEAKMAIHGDSDSFSPMLFSHTLIGPEITKPRYTNPDTWKTRPGRRLRPFSEDAFVGLRHRARIEQLKKVHMSMIPASARRGYCVVPTSKTTLTVGVGGSKPEERRVQVDPAMVPLRLAVDCVIYRRIVKVVVNSEKMTEENVFLDVSVIQRHRALRFLCFEPGTTQFFETFYPERAQWVLMEDFKKMSPKEVEINLEISLQDLVLCDNPETGGFILQFGDQTVAAFNTDMDTAKFAAQADEMGKANAEKAKARQTAATHKLGDEVVPGDR